MSFQFTFANLEQEYQKLLDLGYQVLTCAQYVKEKSTLQNQKILVNRIDIDVSVKKAERLSDMFVRLGIPATFFVRLHANEYNPFSFEHYRILKKIKLAGHEIAYHSEVIDQAEIWGESAEACLLKDINVLEALLDIKVQGVASHGGMTGLNNLDFWRNRKPKDFGFLYEGYDQEASFNLFHESLYVSDSCWTYWKSYQQGKLLEGNHLSPAEHASKGRHLLYLTIHPETYFDRHFYE